MPSCGACVCPVLSRDHPQVRLSTWFTCCASLMLFRCCAQVLLATARESATSSKARNWNSTRAHALGAAAARATRRTRPSARWPPTTHPFCAAATVIEARVHARARACSCACVVQPCATACRLGCGVLPTQRAPPGAGLSASAQRQHLADTLSEARRVRMLCWRSHVDARGPPDPVLALDRVAGQAAPVCVCWS